jgi:hypothetical protein
MRSISAPDFYQDKPGIIIRVFLAEFAAGAL